MPCNAAARLRGGGTESVDEIHTVSPANAGTVSTLRGTFIVIIMWNILSTLLKFQLAESPS